MKFSLQKGLLKIFYKETTMDSCFLHQRPRKALTGSSGLWRL